MITIDVEDWFQVENFKPYIPFSTWNSRELRVERNVHRLLDLFDSTAAGLPAASNSKFKIKNSKLPRRIQATFFILGWIAAKLPSLVKEIGLRGHEIASHGFQHDLCTKLEPAALKEDLVRSKKMLEDITGQAVYGYRAPSFSIDNDILKIIETAGYQYDSSYNSFALHGRYGKVNFNGHPKQGIAVKLSNTFYELPISNLTLFSGPIQNSKFKIQNFQIPLGGGAYFRLIPFLLFAKGITSLLKKESAYLFYMHPWEVDPDQPRVREAKFNRRLRHYTNLHKTAARLEKMIEFFGGRCEFCGCREYIGWEAGKLGG